MLCVCNMIMIVWFRTRGTNSNKSGFWLLNLFYAPTDVEEAHAAAYANGRDQQQVTWRCPRAVALMLCVCNMIMIVWFRTRGTNSNKSGFWLLNLFYAPTDVEEAHAAAYANGRDQQQVTWRCPRAVALMLCVCNMIMMVWFRTRGTNSNNSGFWLLNLFYAPTDVEEAHAAAYANGRDQQQVTWRCPRAVALMLCVCNMIMIVWFRTRGTNSNKSGFWLLNLFYAPTDVEEAHAAAYANGRDQQQVTWRCPRAVALMLCVCNMIMMVWFRTRGTNSNNSGFWLLNLFYAPTDVEEAHAAAYANGRDQQQVTWRCPRAVALMLCVCNMIMMVWFRTRGTNSNKSGFWLLNLFYAPTDVEEAHAAAYANGRDQQQVTWRCPRAVALMLCVCNMIMIVWFRTRGTNSNKSGFWLLNLFYAPTDVEEAHAAAYANGRDQQQVTWRCPRAVALMLCVCNVIMMV